MWQEEGLEAVRKVARKSPESFVAIAAKVCPADVRVSIEQSLPGGLGPEDWSLLQEVIQAVKVGIPDAAHTKPGEVFERVLSALRQADAKLLDIPEILSNGTVDFGQDSKH